MIPYCPGGPMSCQSAPGMQHTDSLLLQPLASQPGPRHQYPSIHL
ncbi:unnamed protein product, partial [Staurois parvus]